MAFQFAHGMFTAHVAAGTPEDPIMLEGNVCRLPDDSLFCSWTTGGNMEPLDKNYVCCSKSHDNGRTWSDSMILFMHPRKGMFCPEAFTLDGKLFAFPAAYNDYFDTSFCQDMQTYISVSRDCGETFTAPACIGNALNGLHIKSHLKIGDRMILGCSWIETHDSVWASYAGANKKCIVAGVEYPGEPMNGRIEFPHPLCHSEFSGVLISDDSGESWRLRGKIGQKGMHLTEPAIVRLSDGTLVMLTRHNADTRLYESRSYDLGETWTEAVRSGIPSTIVKVSLIKDQNGTVYLINHASENRYHRGELNLWISHDDMKTWNEKTVLIRSDDASPCTYPDAFIDEERGLLCFAWDDRKNIYYSEYPIR